MRLAARESPQPQFQPDSATTRRDHPVTPAPSHRRGDCWPPARFRRWIASRASYSIAVQLRLNVGQISAAIMLLSQKEKRDLKQRLPLIIGVDQDALEDRGRLVGSRSLEVLLEKDHRQSNDYPAKQLCVVLAFPGPGVCAVLPLDRSGAALPGAARCGRLPGGGLGAALAGPAALLSLVDRPDAASLGLRPSPGQLSDPGRVCCGALSHRQLRDHGRRQRRG